MSKCTLTETQGKDYKQMVIDYYDVYGFLLRKLEGVRKSQTEYATFDYLKDQCVNTDPDIVGGFIEQLRLAYGNCGLMNHYSQLKIPCTTIPPMPSDAKNNKRCGLITLQSWVISMVMDSAHDSDTLYDSIGDFLKSYPGQVGAHLCKNVCTTRGHVIPTEYIVNIKTHDSCPAFWVVKEKLYSLCVCDGKKDLVDLSEYHGEKLKKKLGNRCIRPGPYFQASVYSSFLTNILDE